MCLFILNTLSPVKKERDYGKWGASFLPIPRMNTEHGYWSEFIVTGTMASKNIEDTAMRNLFSSGNWAKFSPKLLLETTLRTTFWTKTNNFCLGRKFSKLDSPVPRKEWEDDVVDGGALTCEEIERTHAIPQFTPLSNFRRRERRVMRMSEEVLQLQQKNGIPSVSDFSSLHKFWKLSDTSQTLT